MSIPLAPERLLLLKAADEMERRGHAKHTLCDRSGGVCLLGAINAAETGDPYDGHGTSRARELLADHLGGSIGDAVGWNNSHATPGEKVISALRAAAMHGL